MLFFLTVLLMMAGTCCLFTAGAAALLKHLRSRYGYSYQTRHFIGVSSLLYRMKRNAVGLANICILASMVLVTVSGTLLVFCAGYALVYLLTARTYARVAEQRALA